MLRMLDLDGGCLVVKGEVGRVGIERYGWLHELALNAFEYFDARQMAYSRNGKEVTPFLHNL